MKISLSCLSRCLLFVVANFSTRPITKRNFISTSLSTQNSSDAEVIYESSCCEVFISAILLNECSPVQFETIDT